MGLFLAYNALLVLAIALIGPALFFDTSKPVHLRVTDLSDAAALGIKSTVGFRMYRALWRQSQYITQCPLEPKLNGKVALVTGGNGAIGFHTALGLARRGSRVVLTCRSKSRCVEASKKIKAEVEGAKVDTVVLDLADLASVESGVRQISALVKGVHVAVANAGVLPGSYSVSKQGHEIAYAVNNLGHQLLLQRLVERGLLRKASRIVVVTGDIYVLADDCSSSFQYNSTFGGVKAYARSKLGNLWQMKHMAEEYSGIHVYAVHPGVVDAFGSDSAGLAREVETVIPGISFGMMRYIALNGHDGAQTTLLIATRDTAELEDGAYYHNTMGKLVLHRKDRVSDWDKSEVFWKEMQNIIDEWSSTQ